MFVVDQNGNISSSSNYPSYKATYPILDSYVYKDFFKNIPGLEYLGATDATKSQYEEFPYRASLNIENSYITTNTSMPGKPNTPINISWISDDLKRGFNDVITIDLMGDTLVLNSVVRNETYSHYSTDLVFTNGTIKIVGTAENCFTGCLKDATLILNNNSIPKLNAIDLHFKIVYQSFNRTKYNFVNSKIVNFDRTVFDVNLLLNIYKTEFRATVKPKDTPITTKKYTFKGLSQHDLEKFTDRVDVRLNTTVSKMSIIDESSEPVLSFDSSDNILILEDFSIVGATDKNYINIYV